MEKVLTSLDTATFYFVPATCSQQVGHGGPKKGPGSHKMIASPHPTKLITSKNRPDAAFPYFICGISYFCALCRQGCLLALALAPVLIRHQHGRPPPHRRVPADQNSDHQGEREAIQHRPAEEVQAHDREKRQARRDDR